MRTGEGEDLLYQLAERTRTAKGALRRGVCEYTGGILLGACLLLTAVLPLVMLELVNPFSEEFILRTAYTLFTSTLTYFVFLPEGRRYEWGRNPEVARGEEQLTRLSAFVRKGRLAAFSAFCERRAEEEHRRLAAALLNAYPSGSREARRASRRARHLPLHRISPARILAGTGGGEASAAGRRHPPAFGIFLRPLFVLFSSVLFSSVVILPGNALTATTAVQILTGLFGVATAAFAGYTAGVADAGRRLAMLSRRVLFLSAFCEEEGEGAA